MAVSQNAFWMAMAAGSVCDGINLAWCQVFKAPPGAMQHLDECGDFLIQALRKSWLQRLHEALSSSPMACNTVVVWLNAPKMVCVGSGASLTSVGVR